MIVFDDMISDMLSNKKLHPIVAELLIRGRTLNISLVFITRSYFAVPKNIRLNSNHFSSDIDFQDSFKNLYNKYTAKPYYFLVIDATLASDNTSCFRKSLSERI